MCPSQLGYQLPWKRLGTKKPFVNIPKPERVVVAAVIVTVPSVALVIVSPLSRVMEVVEAMPSSWITPSVALLIVSPLSNVNMVVVAPPRKCRDR